MTPKSILWRRSSTACAVLVSAVLMAAAPSAAQSDAEWTLATLARDGSWGVGTSELQGSAMAAALRKCIAMSSRSDCGAEFTAIRSGWTLGILCGEHRVLVAAKELANADREARLREGTLRTLYGNSVPPCLRIMTVDPDGSVTKGELPAVAEASRSR